MLWTINTLSIEPGDFWSFITNEKIQIIREIKSEIWNIYTLDTQ